MNDHAGALAHNGNTFKLARLSRWLNYFFLLVFLLGTILIVAGLFMPAYTDPMAVDRIRSGQECEYGVPNKNEYHQCDSDVWHRSMNSLRTYKWRFVDLGNGLLVSAVTLFAFAKWQARKSGRAMLTPRRAVSIVTLATVAWLMIIPASTLLYFVELARDCCPWWADSASIPIFITGEVVLTLLLPYVALWLIFVLGGRLPVPIFLTVPGRPFVNIVWTGAAVMLLCLPSAYGLVVAIIDGPILMVPFLWLTLWLAICARAAALSRHLPKAALLQA